MNGFHIVIIAICVGLFLSVFVGIIALVATIIFCIAILFDDRLF